MTRIPELGSGDGGAGLRGTTSIIHAPPEQQDGSQETASRRVTPAPQSRVPAAFGAGAGTVDLAIVRYHHAEKRKAITVLAEQGRCRAGSDLDRLMERLVLRKIMEQTGTTNEREVYAAYDGDPELGRVIFEEECEQRKIELSSAHSPQWIKRNFLGRPSVAFQLTRDEFWAESRPVIEEFDGAVRAVLSEARSFVEDFDGVDIVLLVGGTSKLPFVKACVQRHCPGATIERPEGYFDELLATVRGVGFSKDFEGLIIKRPPYTTELFVTLADGGTQTLTIHRAFDKLYEFWKTFGVGVPYHEVVRRFEAPVSTAKIRFISPDGGSLEVPEAEFPACALQGETHIRVRLDVHARLRVEATYTNRTMTVKMPYFAQVGLRPPRPFSSKSLNAPDVYPAEN